MGAYVGGWCVHPINVLHVRVSECEVQVQTRRRFFERSNAEKYAIISSDQRQRLTVFRAILCPWGQADGGGDLGIRVLAEHLTYRDHFIDLRLRQLWNNR